MSEYITTPPRQEATPFDDGAELDFHKSDLPRSEEAIAANEAIRFAQTSEKLAVKLEHQEIIDISEKLAELRAQKLNQQDVTLAA